MSQTFQKKVEDFVCEKCGAVVKGNGYTNHCPQCLWSKHVDVHPGDRAAACGGLMEPIAVEQEGKDQMIVQKCVVCGHTRRNTVVPGDSVNALASVAQKAAMRLTSFNF